MEVFSNAHSTLHSYFFCQICRLCLAIPVLILVFCILFSALLEIINFTDLKRKQVFVSWFFSDSNFISCT